MFRLYSQEILTLLDLNFEELQHLVKEAESIPTSPSLTCPLKTVYTTYTLLELACCKDLLVKSYRSVEELQSMANEQICHLELVLELIQQFENEAEKCHEYLSKYETKVSELRNRMLEGRMTDQPWTSAKQVSNECKSTYCYIVSTVSHTKELDIEQCVQSVKVNCILSYSVLMNIKIAVLSTALVHVYYIVLIIECQYNYGMIITQCYTHNGTFSNNCKICL